MRNKPFMRNMGLKIFSLTFAIILAWFANSNSNSSEIAFTVPVQIQNPPQDKVVLFQSANDVQLRVRGPSFLVSRLPTMSLSFKVRIPPEAEGDYKVTLEPDSLHLEPSVKILAIDPPTVKFSLDLLKTRTVPVVVPQVGKLPASVHLERIEAFPAVVTVSGPKSAVESINNISTGSLDLKSITGDQTKDLPLQAAGSNIRLSDERVSIKVTVSPEGRRKFVDFPVELRTAADSARYRITPQRVTVEVKGAAKVLDELRPEDVIPYVRVPEGTKSVISLTVAVTLPAGVSLVSVAPAQVGLALFAGGTSVKRPVPVKKK